MLNNIKGAVIIGIAGFALCGFCDTAERIYKIGREVSRKHKIKKV